MVSPETHCVGSETSKSREAKASENQPHDKRVNCMECELYFNNVVIFF